jgi:hypothetical protein
LGTRILGAHRRHVSDTPWAGEVVHDRARFRRQFGIPVPSSGPIGDGAELRAEYKPQLEQQANGEDNLTGATVHLLLELCEAVAAEDGRQIGLAASLASIDVGRISETSNDYVQLLDAIMALGLFTQDPSAA